jgi:hypothetical protein
VIDTADVKRRRALESDRPGRFIKLINACRRAPRRGDECLTTARSASEPVRAAGGEASRPPPGHSCHVNVPTGATRDIEFVADNEGDWAFHCHKVHHLMNGMGHSLPIVVGMRPDEINARLAKILPGAMPLSVGMGHMMEMGRPKNTIGSSTEGPFDEIDAGGMFTVLKVRKDIQDGASSVGTTTRPAPWPSRWVDASSIARMRATSRVWSSIILRSMPRRSSRLRLGMEALATPIPLSCVRSAELPLAHHLAQRHAVEQPRELTGPEFARVNRPRQATPFASHTAPPNPGPRCRWRRPVTVISKPDAGFLILC